MTDLDLLEARLLADASAIFNRAQNSRRFLVFDIEYLYDREGQHRADRHAADPRKIACDQAADRVSSANENDKLEVKWPFHRIGCISAMTLAVVPTSGIAVESFETWSRPEMTWGGEFKDIPALLAVAMREGLALPSSLSGGHWQHARLDLSDQLRSKAKAPHLNEYSHAQGLPAKLMAPWELGEAAERGKWTAIREHCECDVTVTAMLLARWLLATGIIRANRAAIDTRIADAVAAARPYRPALLQALSGFVSAPVAKAA
ncbi:MAG: hypothetical protein DI591_12955 [Citromicrobium sp.]|nr:MAG: hypothetical protein DI591_12955 [Citromicrobium sp.]